MIKVKGINYKINNKEILNNISFEIIKGEITVLIGPNGTGKTTLMRLITGDLIANEGEIIFDGKLLKELNAFFCDRLGNSCICSLGRHCGELEKINIVYSDVSDDAITSLAEGCPRLLDLNVAFCDTITGKMDGWMDG